MLVRVCGRNFEAGQATIREALREAWVRRREAREGLVAEAGVVGAMRGGGATDASRGSCERSPSIEALLACVGSDPERSQAWAEVEDVRG
ncbi:hypothetical protein Tdes44962_MAKER10490 [Teratosphaeria destructans]|uniref:Uncharacterized protein n=1 Tax=Teratosphaeria destructans TaxID=418781 RepID=A0A9W7T0N5_9PEZI|nr:hypothetical protein Tdes44962_MAKER10490 [Teratosphaeria destructans]